MSSAPVACRFPYMPVTPKFIFLAQTSPLSSGSVNPLLTSACSAILRGTSNMICVRVTTRAPPRRPVAHTGSWGGTLSPIHSVSHSGDEDCVYPPPCLPYHSDPGPPVRSPRLLTLAISPHDSQNDLFEAQLSVGSLFKTLQRSPLLLERS